MYVKRVIFTLGAVSDTVKNRKQYRSVYVKRVIFILGAVSDTVKNREQHRSVYVKRVIFTLGACQFGREDQANTRIQRARRIRTFDIQYRKIKAQVCVQIRG